MATAPVRVWRVDLADPAVDVESVAAWLDEGERLRAARGLPAVRRRRVLLRGGLRLALAQLLGLAPQDVPIGRDEGRPVLGPGAPRGLALSCSSSGDVGLVAVAQGTRVGIDVERHRPDDFQDIADEGWLSSDEQAGLRRLPDADRSLATTRCWTQKEAVLKGEGTGLRQPPVSVITPLAPAGRIGPWWLTPVSVPAGHLASLAVDGAQPAAAVPVHELTLRGAR